MRLTKFIKNIIFYIKNKKENIETVNFKIKNKKYYIKINNKFRHLELNEYSEVSLMNENGANSVILQGTHKITKRKDIIKIYVPNKRNGAKDVSEQQFKNEMMKIAKLNDSRFVKIHDAFIRNGVYICTMEYIDGETLRDWCNDKKNIVPNISFEKIRNCGDYIVIKRILMAKELLEAIRFYQERNILHGDIHYNNILIDDNDNVHIIDFGASLFGELVENEKMRESYFIYENILMLLKGIIDKKFFTFKKITDIHKLNKNDIINEYDVIKYNPYLVTLTLLAYVEYLDTYQQIVFDSFNVKDIHNLCFCLSQGIYFDYNYIFEDFLYFNKYVKIDKSKLKDIMIGYIYNNIIGEDDFNNNRVEVQVKLLNVYYKFYKNNINEKIITHSKNDKICYIVDSLYDSQIDNYSDFEECYANECEYVWLDNEFKDKCIELLYTEILKFYQNDYFKTYSVIWEKLNEIDFLE